MNAYELAEQLETFDESIFEYHGDKTQAINMQSAHMLRQQQTEIEALKRKLERAEDLLKQDGWKIGEPGEWGYHTYYRKPIKPVAWVDFDIEGVPVQLDYEWGCKMQKLKTRVPLYTTPQDQADRIAELEKCLFQMQNACIDLTKNAEPVAWMDELGDLEKFNHQNKDWIPLYTTPQYKELSDEEIYKTIFESGFDEDLFMTNLNKGDVPISLVLAKTILKKASEK